MRKVKFDVILQAVSTIEMDEEDARLELEIYDEDYLLTTEDWKTAIDKRLKFLLEENFFIKEKDAKIKKVWSQSYKWNY